LCNELSISELQITPRVKKNKIIIIRVSRINLTDSGKIKAIKKSKPEGKQKKCI